MATRWQFEIHNSKFAILLMADPDIARRCLHCGVSIREQAYFCPQCGRELGEPDDIHESASASEDISKAETIAEARRDSSESAAAAPTSPLSSSDADLNKKNRKTARNPSQRSHPPKNVQREQRPRVRAVAQEVRHDNVLQKVQRLREVSSVVIDQASYDPSLRFVLVAAALFVLFLVIVIVSKLIG